MLTDDVVFLSAHEPVMVGKAAVKPVARRWKTTGWGLLIYHHDADCKWRVARDAWGPTTRRDRWKPHLQSLY
jgi:ketosteroid isomerase-like protein